jgi:hypothetical protein
MSTRKSKVMSSHHTAVANPIEVAVPSRGARARAGHGLDLPAVASPAAERAFPACTASHERAISSRVANQTPSNPFA